jgi:glutathione S-transferase
VCARVRTYALPLPEAASGYVERIFALPAMQAWVEAALAEHDFLDFDEPYRKSRD